MIRIDVFPTGEVGIDFSGDKFNSVYKYVKRNHFHYNPSYQYWTDKEVKIYSSLADLRKIDTCRVSLKASSLMEEAYNRKETIFLGDRKLNKDLFLYPPIEGKHPYENYQSEDIEAGINQNRLYFAEDMGTGKTYILSMVLSHLWDWGNVDRVLVLAPSNALYKWKMELQRFTPFFKEGDFYIADRWNRTPFENDPKVVIMTYRTLLMISDDYYKQNNPKKKGVKRYTKATIPLENWGTTRAILGDEFHLVANRSARQSHVLSLHVPFFEYRYAASGTPHPNGIEQLYHQLKLLDTGIIPEDYYTWIKKIAYVGNYFSEYAIQSYKDEEIAKFSERIEPWIIRRRAEDCLELPDHIIDKAYVKLNPKHTKIYQELIKSVLFRIREDPHSKGSVIQTIKNRFPFIHQAIDNPSLLKVHFDDVNYIFSDKLKKMINSFSLKDHSKIEIVDSYVEENIDFRKRKMIIWSGHPLTLDQLAEYYKKYNPLVIHGALGQSNQDRDEILQKFRKSKTHNLLLASYKVISQAIDLVEANVNVYFDRSYDLKEWLQSIKRTHRLGQKETVYTYPIIALGSLDESLDKMLEQKEGFDHMLFGKESLTIEDWKDIFEGKWYEQNNS